MPISKDIEEKIIELSQDPQLNNIVPYLVGHLKNYTFEIEELLDHLRTNAVLKPETVYELGIAVSSLDDDKQKSQDIAFHHLAADLWDIDRNFARARYPSPNQCVKATLIYANKVIELLPETRKNGKGMRSGSLMSAYRIKAQCHQQLGELIEKRKALFLRTFIDDHSVVGIRERTGLLKEQLHDYFMRPVVVDDSSTKTINSTLAPSEDEPKHDRSSTKWSKEALWFDSATFENHEVSLLDERRIFRCYTAENRFFNPNRSHKRRLLDQLATAIIDQRYQESVHTPIDIAGLSSRQIITAEKAYQNAVIALTDELNPILSIPIGQERPRTNGYIGVDTYGPVECFQVGTTTIQSRHKTRPKRDRLGDTFILRAEFDNCGSYNDFYQNLIVKLTHNEVEKEKQLALLMIRYGKTHESVSLEELRAVNVSATSDYIDKFNRLCFLMLDKEQSQWLSANTKKYQLGLSVYQARCLILVKEGFICFKDILQKNPQLGIYSNSGLMTEEGRSAVLAACQRIDALYLAYLQRKHAPDHNAFIASHSDHLLRTCVLTREQAHRDLKEVYGGDSDTDDEGYQTDLSM